MHGPLLRPAPPPPALVQFPPEPEDEPHDCSDHEPLSWCSVWVPVAVSTARTPPRSCLLLARIHDTEYARMFINVTDAGGLTYEFAGARGRSGEQRVSRPEPTHTCTPSPLPSPSPPHTLSRADYMLPRMLGMGDLDSRALRAARQNDAGATSMRMAVHGGWIACGDGGEVRRLPLPLPLLSPAPQP